jgi:tol-pal system protein YbgF
MKSRALLFSLSLLAGAAFALPAQAQLFGPSDAQKAQEAAQDQALSDLQNQVQQQGQQQDARLRQLEDKVQSLTDSLSQATGANENLNHQLDLLNQKLDSQQKDFAYRLCMVSAQQLGAAAGDQGLNCAAAGSGGGGNAGFAPAPSQGFTPGQALPPLTSSAPTPLARPPGTLGTLPASPRGAASAASGGSSAQFDTAMNLLAKAQYAEASAGFRSYADTYPGDGDLSPQAIYWIGDIAYVQGDYQAAARAFAEQIKKYPDSSRTPDSMLKMGQSLLATGQTSGGCTTLGLLTKTKYPQASAGTLAAAAGARKASCSK